MPHEVSAGTMGLIVTCEHATNRVPREYAALFRGKPGVRASHRGYDPGALGLAEHLHGALGRPGTLLRTEVSRLLVECNRSARHPRLFSEFTRGLDAEARERLLDRYYRPHWEAVERRVREVIRSGRAALHIGVHSFTPVLDGERRHADFGVLYDPGRRVEAAFARRWVDELRGVDASFRVRRNYPYRGVSDGLTTQLRRVFPGRGYLGLELEVNNRLLTGPASTRRRVHEVVAQSLLRALRM